MNKRISPTRVFVTQQIEDFVITSFGELVPRERAEFSRAMLVGHAVHAAIGAEVLGLLRDSKGNPRVVGFDRPPLDTGEIRHSRTIPVWASDIARSRLGGR